MSKRRRRGERVSDKDRERVVEELAAHAGAGRLDLEELASRTEQAYTARTVGDLVHATRDRPVYAQSSSSQGEHRTNIKFRFHLAACAAALAVDLAVLAEMGDGLVGPTDETGPTDEVAILAFWMLVAWGALLLPIRAIYALRRPISAICALLRPTLPRGNP